MGCRPAADESHLDKPTPHNGRRPIFAQQGSRSRAGRGSASGRRTNCNGFSMRRTIPVVTIATLLAVPVGCDETAESNAPEVLQANEELAEVDVGEFRIPLAAVDQRSAPESSLPGRNALLLRFRLFAVVPPHREDDVASRIQTHRARLREEVIRTCREATLDELDEPALITLKGELHQVLGRYFGPQHLRQIIMTNVLLEPT